MSIHLLRFQGETRVALSWHIVIRKGLLGNEALGGNRILAFRDSTTFSVVKNPPANAGDASRSLGQNDPLEKEIATHSSILAWRIPWTEEPGGLQSMGLQKHWT